MVSIEVTQLIVPFLLYALLSLNNRQYQLLKDGKKSWLSTERVKILNDVGFEWNPVSAKSKKKSAKKKKGGNKET